MCEFNMQMCKWFNVQICEYADVQMMSNKKACVKRRLYNYYINELSNLFSSAHMHICTSAYPHITYSHQD